MNTASDVGDLHFAYSKQTALWFVVFLLLYEISTYVANDMIMPGMIQVVESFSAPESFVSASLTAYILGGGTLQLFLGPLSDRFGRRPVMIFGAIFFLIATVAIALSQTIHQFIWARFFQGMGLCFIAVIGYATLQEIFIEQYSVRIISIMNSITIIAPLTGPLLGAIVIHYYSWRMVFHIISFSALAALIGIWYFMPETVGKQRLDGTFNAYTSLRFSVVKNNYKELIKNNRFLLGSCALGFLSVPIIAWIGTSPLILIKSAKLSVLDYGLWQIPVFVASIMGNILVRRDLSHRPLMQITEIGSFYILYSLIFCVCLTYVFSGNYLAIIAGVTAYSFWLGYISAPLNRLTLFSTMVPKGTASALISLIMMLIIGAGNEFAGWVYQNHKNDHFSLFLAIAGIIYYLLFSTMKSQKI